MKNVFALLLTVALIWVSAESGFSQTSLISGKHIDQRISDQILRDLRDMSVLRTGGSITGKVISIGPGNKEVEVETRSGIKRSYPIEPGVRFEKLQEALKDLKKGDTVRLELARRGIEEFVTVVEKIE